MTNGLPSQPPLILPPHPPPTRLQRLGRVFVIGLAAVLPTALTLFLLVFAYRLVESNIGAPINRLLSALLGRPLPDLVGIMVAILLVLAIGAGVATFVGKRLWREIESRFALIPILRTIYPYAKQVSEFLFSKKRLAAGLVVIVEYPRKGIWALGFVTGAGLKDVTTLAGRKVATIFIPSSPTPITGYTMFVPVEELVFLDITVDEAIRMLVSAGVITPPRQVQEDLAERLQAEAWSRQVTAPPPLVYVLNL